MRIQSALAIIVLPVIAWRAAVAALAPTSHRQMPAVRVSSPPVIDGALDDACWQALHPITDFTDTVSGKPVADQTVFWIGYDDAAVYMAFHCKDSDPKSIVARETRRGGALIGEDRIRVWIDPFRTRRTEDISVFAINPLGTQNTTIAGGRATKQEWEGVWQSAARIVEDGWTAEIAIPWRVFPHPGANGHKLTVGLNIDRTQARTQIKSQWSYQGSDERPELAGDWVDVAMPPPDRVAPLSVLGYALGGYENRAGTVRMGADARYQASPQLTALATANPDFSNVEGAVTGIDFSYAEKLPAERRPFFLEGADYYWTHGSVLRPFASVRIPQFEVGGKFYGLVAPGTEIGALATSRPGARSDAVMTVRHGFTVNESLGVQLVTTSSPSANNTVGLVSGEIQRGSWNGTCAYMRSFDTTGRGSFSRLGLGWSSKFWWITGAASATSPLFTARDGYVDYVDRKGFSSNSGYYAVYRKGPIAELEWEIDGYHDLHYDGSLFRRELSTYLTLEMRNQLGLYASSSAGTYEQNRDHLTSLGFSYPIYDKFRNYGASYAWGKQDGTAYSALGANVNWRYFGRLSVSATTQIVQLNGTEMQHIASVSYDLSRKQTIGGRLVSTPDGTGGYLSFRDSGYTGTEYYVIVGDPNAPRFAKRIIIKVVQQL